MIIEEIKSINSSTKELRKFGLTVGIALALIGGLFLWRQRPYYYYFFILSAAFVFFGIAVPILLWPVQKVWMSLAVLLGWFMTRVILIVLFYLVVTPIGLLARLFDKDFLNLKFDNNADSYWISKERIKFEKSSYEKQF